MWKAVRGVGKILIDPEKWTRLLVGLDALAPIGRRNGLKARRRKEAP